MHRPRRIFREPDRVEPLSARSREPALVDPSWPLRRDFGGDKLNDAGPQQQKGLPVEIRKPLLHNHSIGCGGLQCTQDSKHSLSIRTPTLFRRLRDSRLRPVLVLVNRYQSTAVREVKKELIRAARRGHLSQK